MAEVQPCREIDLPRLYEFWNILGKNIPYFFPVSFQRWRDCFLEDRLDGELIFASLDTYIREEGGRILGFIQFGRPKFAWDENNVMNYQPRIGVIRYLFFEADFLDTGEALLAEALHYFEGIDQIHAFYHVFGIQACPWHSN